MLEPDPRLRSVRPQSRHRSSISDHLAVAPGVVLRDLEHARTTAEADRRRAASHNRALVARGRTSARGDADRRRERRLVVWLHNHHARYGVFDAGPGRSRSVGGYLRDTYGEDVYSIGFLMVSGEIADNGVRGSPPGSSILFYIDTATVPTFEIAR